MAEPGLLKRLFMGAANRDGHAHAFEELAAAELDEEENLDEAQRRRHRPVALPQTVIEESLAQKVLDAWLQNRQQTLYPLTLNFRSLEPAKIALLVRAMALAMLADGGVDPLEEAQAQRNLASLGADEATRSMMAAALADPPALSALLQEIEAADLGPHAYAASVIALNQRNAVNRLYLEYLAARLAIPTEMTSSLNRRYRS